VSYPKCSKYGTPHRPRRGAEIYPDIGTSLMTKLIRAHSKPKRGLDRNTSYRTHSARDVPASTPVRSSDVVPPTAYSDHVPDQDGRGQPSAACFKRPTTAQRPRQARCCLRQVC